MIRHVVLAAIVLAYAAAAYVSPLPWDARSALAIAPVADLPLRVDQAKTREFLNLSGIEIPRSGPAVTIGNDPPVRLGYSFRQFTLVRLPVLAHSDLCFVLYQEQATGYRMVPLDAEHLALLEQEAGTRLETGYVFPWWRYAWGGLFAIALLGWYLLQRRAELRAREAAGLI